MFVVIPELKIAFEKKSIATSLHRDNVLVSVDKNTLAAVFFAINLSV